MKRRFVSIRQDVKELVVDLDVFGLEERPDSIFRSVKGSIGPSDVLRLLQNVQKREWAFHTDKRKVQEFNKWLQKQYDDKIFIGDWTDEYVTSAYRKGLENGYSQVNKQVLADNADFYQGRKSQFVQSAFNSPEIRSKLELLYLRTFDELKGITSAMSQQLSRALTTGLANGDGPAVIARRMTKTIDKITNTRALTLARTEIINVHASAQLDSYEMMDIGEVQLKAEYTTVGDTLVCPICAPDEGRIMSISEARGLIPQHPNCRCSWNPYIPKRHRKRRRL
jgi:SPP1 gp7 family putative phage head morphogenesis protein